MRRDVAEVLLSGFSSLVLGEAARFAGRKTDIVKAGMASGTLAPLAGGAVVGGAGIARGGVQAAPWLVGAALGSGLAAIRPSVYQTEAEKLESLVNTVSGLSPNDTKTASFGMDYKELKSKNYIDVMKEQEMNAYRKQLADRSLLPQYQITPSNVMYLKPPEKAERVEVERSAEEWWRLASVEESEWAFEPKQTIVLNTIEDLHKVGSFFAITISLVLSGTKDFGVHRMANFMKGAKFRTGGALRAFRMDQIKKKLGYTVAPEMITYPKQMTDPISGRPVQTDSGMRVAMAQVPEKAWIVEFALLWQLNAMLVEGDKGAVFEENEWRSLATATGGDLWKGVVATAGPILSAIAVAALAQAGVPVVGWVSGAVTAIGAAITAVVLGIIEAFSISEQFFKVAGKFELQISKILEIFDLKYEDLPSYRLGLLKDGGDFDSNRLWKIFTYQEEWGLFRKIIAQIPIFYHNLPFSLPCWKDVWRTTYIGIGNNGRGVSFNERTLSVEY